MKTSQFIRFAAALAVTSTLLFGASCSVIDGEDKNALEEKINSMPSGVLGKLRVMAAQNNAYRYMYHKPPNDRVGEIKCRYDLGEGFGWDDILLPDADMLAEYMVQCLQSGGLEDSYISCAAQWAAEHAPIVEARLRDMFTSVPQLKAQIKDLNKLKLDCHFVWDERYNPVTGDVPKNCTDPTAVSEDDIVNAIVAHHVPPPGFTAGEIGILLRLCPLAGPGWGCPSTPNNPSGGLSTGAGAATSGGG
jgi:hypothetical protein